MGPPGPIAGTATAFFDIGIEREVNLCYISTCAVLSPITNYMVENL